MYQLCPEKQWIGMYLVSLLVLQCCYTLLQWWCPVATGCTFIFQGDDMLHEIYYNIGVVEVNYRVSCSAYNFKTSFLCQGPRSDWCDQAAGWPVPLHRQVQGGFNSCLPFLHSANIYIYQVAIWGWSYGGFVTASVLAADADQSNIFKVSVFLLNQNHQRFSSSAASALPQSPTGSTTIPSTLRGCFSNIFWLKYVQCSLN